MGKTGQFCLVQEGILSHIITGWQTGSLFRDLGLFRDLFGKLGLYFTEKSLKSKIRKIDKGGPLDNFAKQKEIIWNIGSYRSKLVQFFLQIHSVKMVSIFIQAGL